MTKEGKRGAAAPEPDPPCAAGDLYGSRCSLAGLLCLFEDEFDAEGLVNLMYEGCGGDILETFAFLTLRCCAEYSRHCTCPETEAVRSAGPGVRPAPGIPDGKETCT